jgi:uncharacterized protein YkwD
MLLALLWPAASNAGTGLVDTVNALRLQGCGEFPATGPALRSDALLDDAARRVAEGEKLARATSESGYLARTSALVYTRATRGDAAVARMLVDRFCDIVADSSLREIGIFQHIDETWMVFATPMTSPAAAEVGDIAGQVLERINTARAKGRRCGRKQFDATTPLAHAAALERAARTHAEDLARNSFLGHEGSDGSLPADRVMRAGYLWTEVAENVAGGQTTADEVVQSWLASPGHCENLMSPLYADTGIAFVFDPAADMTIYWVQVFAAH